MAHRSFVTHPIVLRELTVARVEDVTPRMRRVTLTGDQLGAFHRDGLDLPAFTGDGFDDHVKLIFATAGDVRDKLPVQLAHAIDWTDADDRALRDYTPRRVTAEEVDLDFVLHGDGPAASWALSAQPGDTLFTLGPKSSIRFPDDIDRVVLAGDETALPAIGRFLDERPLACPAQIVVEIGDPAARQDLAVGPDDTLTWVGPGELVDAVIALPWPEGDVYIWAAGESRSLLPLRRWLSREKQLPKSHLNITGYWHAVAEEDGEGDAAAVDTEGTERLLTPVPWFLARTALALGVFDRVAATPCDVATLAASCEVSAERLQPVVDALVAFDLLAHTDAGLALGPVGEFVTADEHLRESLEDTAEAEALLALAHLEGIVRGTTTFAGVTGRSLLARADADGYEERIDEALGFDFVARAVIDHLGDANRVVATGPGAAALSRAVGGRAALSIVESPAGIAALAATVEEERRTFATDFAATSGDLVVSAVALGYRTDDEAIELLTRMRAAADRGWIVEHVGVPPIDDHDAVHALLTLVGTGSRHRTEDDLARLAERAGWTAGARTALGWDHTLLELRASPRG